MVHDTSYIPAILIFLVSLGFFCTYHNAFLSFKLYIIFVISHKLLLLIIIVTDIICVVVVISIIIVFITTHISSIFIIFVIYSLIFVLL